MGPRMEMDHFLNYVSHTRKMLIRYSESKWPNKDLFSCLPLLEIGQTAKLR